MWYWCVKKQNSGGMNAKSRSRANYTWNLVYDKWPPIPVFLPGESHGQRGLAGYSPWGCKEVDTTQQLNNKKGGISYHGSRDKLFNILCWNHTLKKDKIWKKIKLDVHLHLHKNKLQMNLRPNYKKMTS